MGQLAEITELMEVIFSYLPHKPRVHLMNLSRANKQFHSIASSVFWHSMELDKVITLHRIALQRDHHILPYLGMEYSSLTLHRQSIELYAGCVRKLTLCMTAPNDRTKLMDAFDELASFKPLPILFSGLKAASLDVNEGAHLTYCLQILSNTLKELVITFDYSRTERVNDWEIALQNLYDFLATTTTLIKLVFKGRLPITEHNTDGLHRALRHLTELEILWISHPMLDDVGLEIISCSRHLRYLQITNMPSLRQETALARGSASLGTFTCLTGLTISTSVGQATLLLSALQSNLRLLVLRATTRSVGLDAELHELSHVISTSSPNLQTMDMHLYCTPVVRLNTGIPATLSFSSLNRLKACRKMRSFHFTCSVPASFVFEENHLTCIGKSWSLLQTFGCLWVQDTEFQGRIGVRSGYNVTLAAVISMAASLKHLMSVSLPFIMICKPGNEIAMDHGLSSLSVHAIYHEGVMDAATALRRLCPNTTITVTSSRHKPEWNSIKAAYMKMSILV
ncbi:hypothetical protein CALCODRAFT_513053 [Calocera cornea HHB12733]|uniref:F-box domain-containing protein n=1 Tax=Calocera cornea HHB12733 TaxID=1353952 RepID=A0A165CI02_9BASI|nr:hypothetical protein CALCODRAFT_513053 [Calocera cornea HHB12733]